jgi:hypothetical protein
MGLPLVNRLRPHSSDVLKRPFFIPETARKTIRNIDGIEATPIIVGAYNATRVTNYQNGIEVILARQITKTASEDHGVDLSRLMVFDKNSIPYEFKIEYPDGVNNIEDPRSLILPDGRIFIGLTAVFDHRVNNHNIAYSPAIIQAKFDLDGKLVPEGNLMVFSEYNGNFLQARNTLPISVDEEGKIKFQVRIDEENVNHSLTEFVGTTDGKIVGQREIKFPSVYWIGKRVGTVGQPFALPDGTLIQFVHGQEEKILRQIWPVRRRKNEIIYSLGAVVLENGEVKAMTERPLITRKHLPFSREEHHGKSVVYSTDNPKLEDNRWVSLLVTAGDKDTARVKIPVSLVKERLKVS